MTARDSSRVATAPMGLSPRNPTCRGAIPSFCVLFLTGRRGHRLSWTSGSSGRMAPLLACERRGSRAEAAGLAASGGRFRPPAPGPPLLLRQLPQQRFERLEAVLGGPRARRVAGAPVAGRGRPAISVALAGPPSWRCRLGHPRPADHHTLSGARSWKARLTAPSGTPSSPAATSATVGPTRSASGRRAARSKP